MVSKAAELAGINLIHRIRLTLPPEAEVWGGSNVCGRTRNTKY